MPDGDEGFLKQVPDLRARVGKLAQVQRQLDTRSRPAFRFPLASQLFDDVNDFRRQVAGFREPLASEFGKAAEACRTVAEAQLSQVRSILIREPTVQVFRAADPVAGRTASSKMTVIGQT